MVGTVRTLVALAMLVFACTAGAASGPVPDTLQQRIASCTACHGAHGEGGNNGFFPRLAGKPVDYLFRQLQNFRKGYRHYPVMEYTVEPLSDDYMHEIAAYFAAQEVPYLVHQAPGSAAFVARGEQLATKGDASRNIPACSGCHGANLAGVQPDIPGLIGLPYDYLSAQLGSWRSHTRRTAAPDCMAAVVGRLSDADISAAAAYLASRPIPDDARPQIAGSVAMPLRCGSAGG